MNNKREGIADKQIILCGFMGSGKTAVGKILAAKLGRKFVDTDQLIEEELGLTVAAIFTTYGENRFRDTETKIIQGLKKNPPGLLVVATGGGALIRKENRVILDQLGTRILLTASPLALLRRINRQGGRPLLGKTGAPLLEIKTLLTKRAEYYNTCDYSFDTTGKPVKKVAAEIIKTLGL